MTDARRPAIDREKVRAEARKLDGVALRVLLDRAVDLLPDEAFPDLIADYVGLSNVVADGTAPPDLLSAIRAFHRDALAGRYYEAVNVNRRNATKVSRGTEIFVAEHARFVDACLRAEGAGDLASAAEGLALLIDLMRQIDHGRPCIVDFADEAGSWQFNVLWERVLPAWFRSLSPTTSADDWSKLVVDALNDFGDHRTSEILARAREAGTPEQRAALEVREIDLRRGR